MIEAVIHRLKCDDCRAAWISRQGTTPEQSRGEASLYGWAHTERHGGWFDVCPRCVHREKQQRRKS